MAQAPGFEALEQGLEFHIGLADFLLVIDKTVGPVVRDAVVILAHISQHTQEALTHFRFDFGKRAGAKSLQQSNETTAMPCYGPMQQIALLEPAELSVEIGRHVTPG